MLRIDINAEAAAIIIGLCLAQTGNALRCGISMRVWLLRHFAQFLDHMRRRRQIGIAHTKVDNVFTRRTGRRAHRVDFGDDIRRQTLDAVEFFGHWLPFPV